MLLACDEGDAFGMRQSVGVFVPFWGLLIVCGGGTAVGGALLATDVPGPGLVSIAAALLAGVLAIRSVDLLASENDVRGWDKVGAELERARRNGGSLAVARIPLAAPRGSVGRSATQRVEPLLRCTDLVWSDGRSLLVLLPEADSASAQLAIARIAVHVSHLGPQAASVAAFPDDVLTLGALMDQLHPVRRTGSATVLPAPRIPEQLSPMQLLPEPQGQESA